MRKRSQPWIQRKSRFIIAAISALGAVITAYLAITALTDVSAACPTEGCDKVLSSPYAVVFGLPLALFGFLAYVAMGVFAVAPWLINPETHKSQRRTVEDWTWRFLLMGSVAMGVFSLYLMYIMVFEIQAFCLYCVASAICALALLGLTLVGQDWDDIGQIFFTGIIVAFVTFVGSLAIYSPIHSPAAETETSSGYAITTTSTPDSIALAEHLSDSGAIMYGAFWCDFCLRQKQLFGREAAEKLNYIECDANGVNPDPAACQAAGIQSYPSWRIDGQVQAGMISLEELADLSGYTGSRDF
ncbi:MAG: vitamin K epoxide reductase family protein [Phormidium sp. BM_Day4_Bin.17]|nr:vitamin K epoxide reductase family protein [Phormidium sp. BM_Day4_Bin.17]UCJ12059.1 MAG: vitamin K epoxide reductase family protein [Phormidium sp. PBR-2020]